MSKFRIAALAAVSFSALFAHSAFADELPQLKYTDVSQGLDETRANAKKTAAEINKTRNQVNKNTAAVAEASKAVESHDAQIKANTNGVAENAKGVADNKKAAEANAKGVADNAKSITAAENSIGDAEFRKTSVQSRLDEMNARFATGGGASKNYVDNSAKQTLKQANDYTDSKYKQLDGKVKKLRARADSGIAGATAIASLPFSEAGANSIAGGLGAAKNKVAGAIGYQHNFGNQWRARATVSASDNYVQGGAGIGYSW